MQANQDTDYKQLITDIIKKQIVVLGPSITLAKARNVKGLTFADDGTVTSMTGRPQEVIQELIDQFVQLSGLIVKKTMEPLLAGYPDGITTSFTPQQEQITPPPTPQVNANTEASPQPPSGEAGSGSARQTPPPQPTGETTQTQNTDTDPNG